MRIINALREPQPAIRAPRWVAITFVAVILALAVISPFISAPYVNFDRSMVLVYVVVGLSLNLLTGYTGQISLGHGAFFALGAYLSAILTSIYGWNYLLTLPVAALVCYLVGYAIGRPALRLQGLQLALVTLALVLVTPSVIKRFDGLTHGHEGMNLNIADAPIWTGLDRDQWVYLLCLAVAVISYIAHRRLATGRVGRTLVGIRDDEVVVTTLGIRPATMKTHVFAVSAAFTGVAGVLYTYVVQFLGPEAFGLPLAITFITIIVVGGLGATAGAIFGAVFVVYAPDLTASLDQSAAGITYGVALVLFMFLLPTGIIGLVRSGYHRAAAMLRRPSTGSPPAPDDAPEDLALAQSGAPPVA